MGGILSSLTKMCRKMTGAFRRKEETSISSCRKAFEGNNTISNSKFKKHILTNDNFKDYQEYITNTNRTTNDSQNLNNFSASTKNLQMANLSKTKNAINSNPNNKHCQNLFLHENSKYSNIANSSQFYHTFPNTDQRFKHKIYTSPKKIKLDNFEILKVLGKGTFGKVLLVRYKNDLKLYAMKVLKKDKIFKTNQIDHTKTERTILEKINHPFIVKLHFAFQTEDKLYLVTEFMQGGELFFHLKREKVFKEQKVKIYVSEIVLAIEHLHMNKIIYRDLKPENILLDVDGHIKLADFGLSKFFLNNINNEQGVSPLALSRTSDREKAFSLCGTPEYLAPEILTGKGYDTSVDWWSLGVLVYEMLCGGSPFKKRREKRLDLNYYQQAIDISNKPISEEAKNFILSLLKNNPDERLCDPNLIKSHAFFADINFTHILNKKLVPDFVPNNFLKNEDDLSCFDKNFTESSVASDSEKCVYNANFNANINSSGKSRGKFNGNFNVLNNELLNLKNEHFGLNSTNNNSNINSNPNNKNNSNTSSNKNYKVINSDHPFRKFRRIYDNNDFKNFSFNRAECLVNSDT